MPGRCTSSCMWPPCATPLYPSNPSAWCGAGGLSPSSHVLFPVRAVSAIMFCRFPLVVDIVCCLQPCPPPCGHQATVYDTSMQRMAMACPAPATTSQPLQPRGVAPSP
eukprot:EG_transcript_22337